MGLVHGRRRIRCGGTKPSRNPHVPGRRSRAAKLQHTTPRTGKASWHDTRALAVLQSGGAATANGMARVDRRGVQKIVPTVSASIYIGTATAQGATTAVILARRVRRSPNNHGRVRGFRRVWRRGTWSIQ